MFTFRRSGCVVHMRSAGTANALAQPALCGHGPCDRIRRMRNSQSLQQRKKTAGILEDINRPCLIAHHLTALGNLVQQCRLRFKSATVYKSSFRCLQQRKNLYPKNRWIKTTLRVGQGDGHKSIAAGIRITEYICRDDLIPCRNRRPHKRAGTGCGNDQAFRRNPCVQARTQTGNPDKRATDLPASS